MNFSPITLHDLNDLKALQPADWPDIVTDIEKYLNWSFCHPFKLTINNSIVGTGSSIVFEKTGWLAHIIVHPDFRNKGLGTIIVNELLKHQKDHQVKSSLLIATKLGYPVYQKAGFRPVDEYIFLKRDTVRPEYLISSDIIPYSKEYKQTLLELDKTISCENREKLIEFYLSDSLLYVNNDKLEGFYFPTLKEGPIYANTESAGIELMKLKYVTVHKAVMPAENKAGITFLKHYRFSETTTTGTRMIFGEEIPWHPEMVFSRIGGNFG